jgi:predicted ATPase
VTFLFTDIEGSTRLLRREGEASYAEALAVHRRALRDAFARHGGVEIDTQGDAFFYAFATPGGAIDAAREGDQELEAGPVRVRIGIHTGTAIRTDEGYVGEDVHRAARIAAAGSGGQILVSAATAAAVDRDAVELLDLGDHRFKDLDEPERVFQLGHDDFPPIRSLFRSSLPTAATAFIGRDREVAAVQALIEREDVRLVTLTGPGGTGKTRLAIRAAEASSRRFPDGTWWVPLADLSDPGLVLGAIAAALGVADDGSPPARALAAKLAGARALVVLDNAEQVLPDLAKDVADLLAAAPGLTIVVTSRERLRIAAEHEFPLAAMDREDAIALFVARAAASGVTLDAGPDVERICDRLDRLPLALVLAAPRLTLFSLHELDERLGSQLDLLRGGRDADPRQATLRATIAWSYDLLSGSERRAFERVSVFVGGCTIAAAEDVASVDADDLQTLIDKSLLQRREGQPARLWMYAAIQGFARERLAAGGEEPAIRRAHARWCEAFAAGVDADLARGEPEELAVAPVDAEFENLRAAVEFCLAEGEVDAVRTITVSLPMFWTMRDRYSEARTWLERAVRISDEPDHTRGRLLRALAAVAYRQGDHERAIAVADEAAALTMQLGGVTDRYAERRDAAWSAWDRGDLDEAERLFAEVFEIAVEVDNGVGMSSSRINRGSIANLRGRHARADELLEENLSFVRSRGQSRCEAFTLLGLAETAILDSRPGDAVDRSVAAARRALGFGELSLTSYCLDIAAAGLAATGEESRAATILGATERARERLEVEPDADEVAMRRRATDPIAEALPPADVEAARARGREMDLAQAAELASAAPSTSTA